MPEDGEDRRAPNNMREIVLPLAVVIGLIVNALFVGVAWGRLGQRLDTNEALDMAQNARIEKAEDKITDLRDVARDLVRDRVDDRRAFDLLEDYTRGRIDRLPYHAPAAPPRARSRGAE